MNTAQVKRVLETALVCASAPLSLADLRALFDDALPAETLRGLVDEVARDWDDSGVEVVDTAGGWRLRSRPEMRPYLERLHPDKPPRYSRAVLETLAVVAYRGPVTRGDIEDIRGVTVGTPILRQLEERGWVDCVGHRDTVGRPALYATTRRFLDDLGLASLVGLPPLEPTPAGEPPAAQAPADMAPPEGPAAVGASAVAATPAADEADAVAADLPTHHDRSPASDQDLRP